MFSWLFDRRRRNEEFLRELVKAAAEGHQLHRLRQAIARVSADKLDGTDATENAGVAAAALVNAIVAKSIGQIDDEDDRFVSGLFAVVFSNHFSMMVAGTFEFASTLAVLRVLGTEQFKLWFNAIISFYNEASRADSQEIQAIGITCALFYNEPSTTHFEKLVELFELCRKNVKMVDPSPPELSL
jgi:hypothetical protein